MVQSLFQYLVVFVNQFGFDFLARIKGDLLAVRLNATVQETQVALLTCDIGRHLAKFGRDSTHQRCRGEHYGKAKNCWHHVVEILRLGH